MKLRNNKINFRFQTMKVKERLRLRKALHDDYERGVQYVDALARIHQQHGKKAVARTTLAKWWKQFSNGEAPLTLPRNARTAVGQFNNSSIELRAATQRADFIIPARNDGRSSLHASSRAIDGRFVYFNCFDWPYVKKLFIVDLLYSQIRFAFYNKCCLHFGVKTLKRIQIQKNQR